MVSECAVCMITDENLPQIYGIITPSIACGSNLTERLINKGINFYIDE